MTTPFVTIPVGRANPRAKQLAGPAESSSRQAFRFQAQADSRKRGALDHGIHNHVPGGRLVYTVSIMEFRKGKVLHETRYFADPFEAPALRRQWVQQIA